MKIASRIALAIGAAAILLAIWQPVGSWWQWALTAVLFIVAGTGFGAANDMPRKYAEGGVIPLRDAEVLSGTGNEELDQKLNSRPTYGMPSKEKDR